MSLCLNFAWTGSERCHSETNPPSVILRYGPWLGFGSHITVFVTKEKNKQEFICISWYWWERLDVSHCSRFSVLLKQAGLASYGSYHKQHPASWLLILTVWPQLHRTKIKVSWGLRPFPEPFGGEISSLPQFPEDAYIPRRVSLSIHLQSQLRQTHAAGFDSASLSHACAHSCSYAAMNINHQFLMSCWGHAWGLEAYSFISISGIQPILWNLLTIYGQMAPGSKG